MLVCGGIYATTDGLNFKNMATRLEIAYPDIVKEFERGPRILRTSEIAAVFHAKRQSWRLAQRTKLKNFIEFLSTKSELRTVHYPFPDREIVGYTWGRVPLLETLLKLVERSFYSHYTAMRIHGLTEQVPKTIYLNREKYGSSSSHTAEGPYDQSAIDRAFKGQPRTSHNEIELVKEQRRVVLLQSAYHGGIGIEEGPFYEGSEEILLRYTNLERTMIDIVTRPFYAGGVSEVAKAFENAKGKLAVNKMSAMLKQMNLGYPYHQAIGYYLERAGYKSLLVEIFHRQPMERDFYLTYGIKNTVYCPKWRLFIPQGF